MQMVRSFIVSCLLAACSLTVETAAFNGARHVNLNHIPQVGSQGPKYHCFEKSNKCVMVFGKNGKVFARAGSNMGTVNWGNAFVIANVGALNDAVARLDCLESSDSTGNQRQCTAVWVRSDKQAVVSQHSLNGGWDAPVQFGAANTIDTDIGCWYAQTGSANSYRCFWMATKNNGSAKVAWQSTDSRARSWGGSGTPVDANFKTGDTYSNVVIQCARVGNGHCALLLSRQVTKNAQLNKVVTLSARRTPKSTFTNYRQINFSTEHLGARSVHGDNAVLKSRSLSLQCNLVANKCVIVMTAWHFCRGCGGDSIIRKEYATSTNYGTTYTKFKTLSQENFDQKFQAMECVGTEKCIAAWTAVDSGSPIWTISHNFGVTWEPTRRFTNARSGNIIVADMTCNLSKGCTVVYKPSGDEHLVTDILTIPDAPTKRPTNKPTRRPTNKPSKKPTSSPTRKPTQSPTRLPTEKPSTSPTWSPTKEPTFSPTSTPTFSPTQAPTPLGTDDGVDVASVGVGAAAFVACAGLAALGVVKARKKRLESRRLPTAVVVRYGGSEDKSDVVVDNGPIFHDLGPWADPNAGNNQSLAHSQRSDLGDASMHPHNMMGGPVSGEQQQWY